MYYKILIVLIPKFDPNSGGVQMSTYKMGSFFSANHHEVHVFSFANSGHIDQNFAVLHHASENNFQNNQLNLVQLSKVVQKVNPHIVINQMPYEHGISNILVHCKKQNNFLLLSCLRNTLFSVIKNIDSYRERSLPSFAKPFFNNSIGKKILLQKHKINHATNLKRILDYYDYFVVFGPPNKKEIEYFIGDYKSQKIAFIPNSIPEVLKELPEKEKIILYLSRLGYTQKRADLILPLWKKVMNQLPDWRMEIVGAGSALDDIKSQIEQEKLPRVKVFGKQKPDEYYRKAPIYIMTSAFEGFPNTLIEAQSFGAVPIIFDNYPMASWVANNEKDAFLIPPFEIEKMAEKILFLAKNEDKRYAMGIRALENARRFAIEKVGKKWLEFFNEELENSASKTVIND